MSSQRSKYKDFVQMRRLKLSKNKTFNVYNYQDRSAIESALWPNLYPFTNWFKTVLKGNESRLSTKVSFWQNLTSEIAEYSMLYDLLQFHYDLWLCQMVSSAIASARRNKCSPNKALESKSFSEFFKK